MPKSPLTIPNISRRTKRRGMVLSATVGIVTLGVGFARSPHVVKHPLVVATRTLPAGTVVSSRDIQVITLPATFAGAETTVSAVVGHPVSETVVKHQPIMTHDLQPVHLVDGLAPGEVGVMLPVSLASSDNVKPGDRVSVIWLGAKNNTQTNASHSTSSTNPTPGSDLATGLRVLAVLNSSGGSVQSYATGGLNAATPAAVEVAVPRAQAGTLAVAAESGRFWLALDPWSKKAGGLGVRVLVPETTPTPAKPHGTTSSSQGTARHVPSSPRAVTKPSTHG